MRRRNLNGGRFEGGPLAACSWELDALYYGTIWENERRIKDWKVRNSTHHEAQIEEGVAEEDLTDLPRPRLLDTTEWIAYLHLIEDPESLPGHANPAKAVDFRLDVLRSLTKLAPSRQKVFVHFMDGFDLEEIASLMGKNEEDGGGWQVSSVQHALREASRMCRKHGDSLQDAGGKFFIAVPNTSEASRMDRVIADIRLARDRQLRNRSRRND